MSYNITAISIKNKKEDVLKELKAFASENKAELLEIPSSDFDWSSDYNFKLDEQEGITVIALPSMGFIPKLCIFLSKNLQTQVMTLAEYETVGFQHFSTVESGKETKIFTFMDEVVDEINVDYKNIIDEAVLKGFMIRPGTFEEEYPFIVFEAFVFNQGKPNSFDHALEMLKSSENESYLFQGLNLKTMGQEEGMFWQQLR